MRRGLSTRHARQIRQGILAARIIHTSVEDNDFEHASVVYAVVASTSRLARYAMMREWARLVVTQAEKQATI